MFSSKNSISYRIEFRDQDGLDKKICPFKLLLLGLNRDIIQTWGLIGPKI